MSPSPSLSVGAPPVARLLARMAGRTAVPPADGPVGRLGGWIDWPHAVKLSRALDAPAAAPGEGRIDDTDEWVERAAAERAALAAEIAAGPAEPPSGPEPELFRQHVRTVQRGIQSSCARLRGELQEQLACGSPAQAHLAAVDSAMEAALSPREQILLASVPDLVAARLGSLLADSPESGHPDQLRGFHKEVRDLLLAELELRFLPIDGLLAALRNV